MGVTINEVALLGIVDNLPPRMSGLADMLLANDTTNLNEIKRVVLEKQDAAQRMEVDNAVVLDTTVGLVARTGKPLCVWCHEEGHTAHMCPHRRQGAKAQGSTQPPRESQRCYECNKMGHIARNCPRKMGAQASVAQLLQAAVEPTA